MTREDAINNLNMIRFAFVEAETKEQRKIIDDTFNMAIKALEQEPVCIGKVEFDEDKLREIVKEQISLIAIQEPYEDLISRADAIDACDQSINLLEAVDRIKELPRK